MTAATPPTAAPGAPFDAMLRGAILPAALAGGVVAVGYGLAAGWASGLSAALGAAVALGFFASGMVLLSKLVRSANPQAFVAVAMAVYLGQVLVLLGVMVGLGGRAWVDGPALGLAALVVTVLWQGFGMRALRRSRSAVYDPAGADPR